MEGCREPFLRKQPGLGEKLSGWGAEEGGAGVAVRMWLREELGSNEHLMCEESHLREL